MTYDVLKLTHVSCVVVSASLFTYRFLQLRIYPDRSLAKTLKVLPHIVDTVLLAAAIGMLIVIGTDPFQVSWLTAKMVVLLLYIGLGAMCLRATPGSLHQTALFIASLAAFSYIVVVALYKQVDPFS